MRGTHLKTHAYGVVAAVAAAVAIAATPALALDPAPYGKHDAGGCRNILPPGEKGTDNAVELGAFMGTGQIPDHWMDQQPLYEGLVYATAKPSFGMAQVNKYFKDATFGVPAGHIESTFTPKPGVTIVRDDEFGVPHIYGVTRADTMFGAGYANAQDRLFLMDILRHTGRAELSSFVGGSPSNRAMDAGQWAAAPYTDADLQMQYDRAEEFYGQAGVKLQQDVTAYVDGINAYVQAALLNPDLLPGEYAALAKLPQPWSVTDVIAEASLIGGIFGRGGGSEVRSAELEQAFVKRFGAQAGKRAWADFREKNDPEAPTTVVGKRFPYETTSPFAKRGLAMPDVGSVKPVPTAPKISKADRAAAAAAVDPSSPYDFAHVGAALRRALHGPGHASNWELVAADESKTGHPVGVLGPQVGYYQPQVLMEMDLHGPGVDARGATFPGVGLYILLGHGRDYSWSATTATSDNVDTFAELLCQDRFHYRWKGDCLPMEQLERHNSWTPNAVDMTPPGSETLTAYRTVHGIVYARGKVHGKKVAFVSARSTYFHEADSALFFRYMNDPKFIDGPSSFRKAAKFMNFAFNWSYIDSKHTAYQLTGWYPDRAKGTSPDFPVLGTGAYDWKGFDPDRHEGDWLGQKHLPHVVDQPYMVSWNNKQAPGWAAADDKFSFGPIYRQQMIAKRVRHDIHGSRKISLPQLVRAMDLPATTDIRGLKLLPILFRAVGHPSDPKLSAALAKLRAWHAAGAHRWDLDKNGSDEMTPAITLMDAWWPKLVAAEFRPALGKDLYAQTQGMLGLGGPGFSAPNGEPSFSDGWYGYVSKDLRDIFGPAPRGAYSRGYCGHGSSSGCRTALRKSLLAATKVSAQKVYGYGDCSGDPQPSCWDQDRAVHTSGISTPEIKFQNRPTFQQTVSVKHAVK
jgi:acyl-homoserine lactone acylase PvdQ